MIKTILKLLFWAIVTWLVVKALIFQTFRIPSTSMYPTLVEGDFVIINKLAYGARLPITPLGLKFNGHKKYLDWITLPYWRMPGFDAIQRNDIIAFNYALLANEPVDMREEFIKRCIGLPGDSIRLSAGDLYVNRLLLTTTNAYRRYHVSMPTKQDSLLLKRSGITAESLSGSGKDYDALLTQAQADSLAADKHVKITVTALPQSYYHPSVYPNSSEFPWNADHFGPLWIPKRGDSIALNRKNLILYQRCIEVYEKKNLAFSGDSVFVNNKRLAYYVFEQNYYFMLGDNRSNSIDSRVIGLIPEDHIIGKASFVIGSSNKSARKFIKLNK